MKYRKKPVVIEAVQWTGDNIEEVQKFGMDAISKYKPYNYNTHSGCLVIHTLEGDMMASKGDFIIKGIKGEFYPCKPDIFEASYDVIL